MNFKYLLISSLLIFGSCRGGSGGSVNGEGEELANGGSDSGGVIPSSVTISEAKANEISVINQKFNSDQKYQLTDEELQMLIDEGALTEEEKSELISMFNNK